MCDTTKCRVDYNIFSRAPLHNPVVSTENQRFFTQQWLLSHSFKYVFD